MPRITNKELVRAKLTFINTSDWSNIITNQVIKWLDKQKAMLQSNHERENLSDNFNAKFIQCD